MYFTVNFKLPNENSLHIHNMTEHIGLDLAELIYEELGFIVPVDQLKVKHECPSFNNSTYTIVIRDEKILKKIPQFRSSEKIKVIVPDGFLGKFWDMKIERGIQSSNYSTFRFILSGFSKKLCEYDIHYEMDNTAIINEWINDGCPEKWNVNNKDIIHDSRYTYLVVETHSYINSTMNFIKPIYGSTIKEAILTSSDFTKEHYVGPSAVIRKSQINNTIETIINEMNESDCSCLLNRIKSRIKSLNQNKEESKSIVNTII